MSGYTHQPNPKLFWDIHLSAPAQMVMPPHRPWHHDCPRDIYLPAENSPSSLPYPKIILPRYLLACRAPLSKSWFHPKSELIQTGPASRAWNMHHMWCLFGPFWELVACSTPGTPGHALHITLAPAGPGPVLQMVPTGTVCSMVHRSAGAGTTCGTVPDQLLGVPQRRSQTCGMVWLGAMCSTAPILAALGSSLHMVPTPATLGCMSYAAQIP